MCCEEENERHNINILFSFSGDRKHQTGRKPDPSRQWKHSHHIFGNPGLRPITMCEEIGLPDRNQALWHPQFSWDDNHAYFKVRELQGYNLFVLGE